MIVIVVPIYRGDLRELELISFMQLINTLNKYDIYIVAPENIRLPDEVRRQDLPVKYFQKEYFESVHSYNRLMLSVEFYKSFENYEYMLIYQLDAFVFEDQLKYFCSLNYDYIGAPWIRGLLEKSIGDYEVCWVGNGGFSIRKIKSTINLLKEYEHIANSYGMNEDVFFAASAGIGYKVAPMDVALTFSFEMEVQKCYELNSRKLPFGCHAWHKYDLLFWKPFFENFGYHIKEKYISEGNQDVLKQLDYQRQHSFVDFYTCVEKHEKLKIVLQNSFIKAGKLYIWGSGYYGLRFYLLFKRCGIEVEAFIDSDNQKQGEILENHNIRGFEEISKENIFVVVCVTNGAKQIQEDLETAGYMREKDFLLMEDLEKLYYAIS